MTTKDEPSAAVRHASRARSTNAGSAAAAVAIAQGVYFAATGVWPIVHMRSFEAVTGPKVDKWLVKTIGGLIAVVGGVLVMAGVRRNISAEIAALAIGSATALGATDAIYAGKGTIAPIYLADAAVEGAVVAAWACIPTCRK